MDRTLSAVLLALVAALCIAVGNVVRGHVAVAVDDADLGRLGVIDTLVQDARWWFGTAVGVVGYAAQAAALGAGSLLLVQPLLVASLLFALPLSAHFGGRRVTAGEVAWAVVLTVSIAVIVVVGDPRPGSVHASTHHWRWATLVCVVAAAAGLFAARSTRGHRRALLLGLVSGLLFGIAAVLTKGVVDRLGHGIAAVLTSPQLWVLVAVGATAVVVQQNAYQAGDLRASLPASTVTEPVVASTLGVVALGEHFDVDDSVAVVLVVAAVATVAATWSLARSSAD